MVFDNKIRGGGSEMETHFILQRAQTVVYPSPLQIGSHATNLAKLKKRELESKSGILDSYFLVQIHSE
jgi:hypothetical protein